MSFSNKSVFMIILSVFFIRILQLISVFRKLLYRVGYSISFSLSCNHSQNSNRKTLYVRCTYGPESSFNPCAVTTYKTVAIACSCKLSKFLPNTFGWVPCWSQVRYIFFHFSCKKYFYAAFYMFLKPPFQLKVTNKAGKNV